MPRGTASLDFGSFVAGAAVFSMLSPTTSLAITGQTSILATALVDAWLRVEPAGSADHSMDEHLIENIRIRAGNIVAGTGFTIYGECTLGGTYGIFTVNWGWINP